MNTGTDHSGNLIAPNRDPLARSSFTTSVSASAIVAGVLTANGRGGMVYRVSPALDERVRFVIEGVVLAVSEKACEELYREAKAWGVTGVRFAVA